MNENQDQNQQGKKKIETEENQKRNPVDSLFIRPADLQKQELADESNRQRKDGENHRQINILQKIPSE